MNMKDAVVALVRREEQVASIQGQPVHVTSQLTSENSKRRNDARIENLQRAMDAIVARADKAALSEDEHAATLRRVRSLNREMQRRLIARAEALEK